MADAANRPPSKTKQTADRKKFTQQKTDCKHTLTMNHHPTSNISSGFVAPPSSPLLDDFRAGVTACLRSWSALRAAVEGGWGGTNDSVAKAEHLRQYIFQYMDGTSFPPRTLTIDDLEDNLAIYMEEEFSVVLEDGSERQVASDIWTMYEQCMKNNTNTLAKQLILAANTALQQSSQYPVQVQSMQDDEDDDEEDDDGDMEMDDDNDVVAPSLVTLSPPPSSLITLNSGDYAAQALFGPSPPAPVRRNDVPTKPVRQLGEAIPTTPSPEAMVQVDEDGFAPVVVKRKGGRKKNS
jgi:pre-rRNA-processing protein TSR2